MGSNARRLAEEDATMLDWVLTSCLRNYQFLSEAVTDVTWNQWQLLAAQSQLGIRVWNAMLGGWPPMSPANDPQSKVVKPGMAGAPDSLEKVATERLKSGFAPPREIYDVRNRDKIDWLSVPDWARAPDPEMFEGGHEG
jgi:hypothetical protein